MTILSLSDFVINAEKRLVYGYTKMIKKELLLIVLLFPICGCIDGLTLIKPVKPVEPLKYYRYPGYDISTTGMVLMLEMENDSANPELARELTMALSEEIQKKQIFGLETLYMSDSKWKSLNISLESGITTEKRAEIQEEFKSDAILFGKIISYRPYPRTSIGLKLKLIDCTTGDLLWAIDRVWDSADSETEVRVKSFFKKQMRSNYDPLDWKMVMLSPRMYNKFVTYEISETLE